MVKLYSDGHTEHTHTHTRKNITLEWAGKDKISENSSLETAFPLLLVPSHLFSFVEERRGSFQMRKAYMQNTLLLFLTCPLLL